MAIKLLKLSEHEFSPYNTFFFLTLQPLLCNDVCAFISPRPHFQFVFLLCLKAERYFLQLILSLISRFSLALLALALVVCRSSKTFNSKSCFLKRQMQQPWRQERHLFPTALFPFVKRGNSFTQTFFFLRQPYCHETLFLAEAQMSGRIIKWPVKKKRPTDVNDWLQYLSNGYKSFLFGPEVNNKNPQQSCSQFISLDAKTRKGKMLLAVIFAAKSTLSHCLLLFRDKEISVRVFCNQCWSCQGCKSWEYIDFPWFYAETAAKEKEIKSYKPHKIKLSMISAFFLGLVPTASAHQPAELTGANEPTWCHLFTVNYRKRVVLREVSSDPNPTQGMHFQDSVTCCYNQDSTSL